MYSFRPASCFCMRPGCCDKPMNCHECMCCASHAAMLLQFVLQADEHFASEGQALPRGLASEVWRVLTTPSFLVIVGQGFLGSMVGGTTGDLSVFVMELSRHKHKS